MAITDNFKRMAVTGLMVAGLNAAAQEDVRADLLYNVTFDSSGFALPTIPSELLPSGTEITTHFEGWMSVSDQNPDPSIFETSLSNVSGDVRFGTDGLLPLDGVAIRVTDGIDGITGGTAEILLTVDPQSEFGRYDNWAGVIIHHGDYSSIFEEGLPSALDVSELLAGSSQAAQLMWGQFTESPDISSLVLLRPDIISATAVRLGGNTGPNPNPVSEPGALALMGGGLGAMGLAGAFARMRRRDEVSSENADVVHNFAPQATGGSKPSFDMA